MSAPIVEEGRTQRTTYFPADIWYSLHNGQLYKAGSTILIENNLTDLVPLYIRNGFFILRQNVDNVTKTDHLNSIFELVGGFKL
jgi:alpha-glucosidase (family GH31 glycosyl hydrolase)